MTTDATTEDLGWEPLLNRPMQIAGGLLVAAYVPCFSAVTTTTKTINGVTTVSHSTDYGGIVLGAVAVLAYGMKALLPAA